MDAFATVLLSLPDVEAVKMEEEYFVILLTDGTRLKVKAVYVHDMGAYLRYAHEPAPTREHGWTRRSDA